MEDQKKKRILLRYCSEVLLKPHVTEWYNRNLEKQPQADTIKSLLAGVNCKNLTVEEALCIALIVGTQWYIKFE